MKLKHVILPAMAGLVIGQASVQGQTYEDKGSVVIGPGVDFSEKYVNRVMEEDYQPDSNGSVVYIGSSLGASYTAKNINITNAGHDDTYCGILIYNGNKYINLSADEGTWNTITVKAIDKDPAWAIVFDGTMTETSTISNTRMSLSGAGDGGGLYVHGESVVVLDNVEIDVNNAGVGMGVGIDVDYGGVVTNADKRGVSVTVDISGTGSAVLDVANGSTIELFDSTITAVGSNSFAAVMAAQQTEDQWGINTISLTNSTISSAAGNNLIADISGELNVNLDSVDLSNAKGQNILVDANYAVDGNYDVVLNLNLSNGTAFDGSASTVGTEANTATSNVVISSGASWNVTRDSTLGLTGSLSLGADGSFISFVSADGSDSFSDDFTNINAASIMLAEGSFLKLDKNASAFEVGDIITLFTGAEGDAFTNNGALMVTLDGQYIDYIDHDNGTFEIRGIIPSIPEPTTASFGLAALGLLALRRRKE